MARQEEKHEGFIVEHRYSHGEEVISYRSAVQSLVSTPSASEDKSTASDWITSGTNDDYLFKLRELVEKSTVLMPGIRFNAAMQYGGGVDYGKIEVVDGERVFKAVSIPEIDKFLERNRIHEQLYTGLLDLEAFCFCIPQFGFNIGGKINRLSFQNTRASWCRPARKDKQGNIPYVFVSADMGKTEFKKSNAAKILCAPEYISDEWIAKIKKDSKEFVAWLRLPDLGSSYFPTPDYVSYINSGWYDIAQLIAESKKYMFQNQFAVKYHIEFHPKYWEAIFGGENWAKFTPAEKAQRKQEELDRMVEFLKGGTKTGATFFSERGGPAHALESLVKFGVIEDKSKADGAFMKESNESSDHALSTLSIHPEIIGNAPGSKLGSGSGSGNRVAFNQRVALSLIRQSIVLESLRIASEVNGWDVKWMMRNSLITTLDSGAEATKPKTAIPNPQDA